MEKKKYNFPEVKLGQYKGLEAPKAEVKVTAADVTARLKEMADRNSRLVSVERAVKKGDTVLVLEAMKMENNITAEADGKVTGICVSAGDSVMEGTTLLTIG